MWKDIYKSKGLLIDMKKKVVSKNNRKSNFELLRILSMIMIVAHHFSLYTNIQIENFFCFENFILEFF